jgi:hypothetical protein
LLAEAKPRPPVEELLALRLPEDFEAALELPFDAPPLEEPEPDLLAEPPLELLEFLFDAPLRLLALLREASPLEELDFDAALLLPLDELFPEDLEALFELPLRLLEFEVDLAVERLELPPRLEDPFVALLLVLLPDPLEALFDAPFEDLEADLELDLAAPLEPPPRLPAELEADLEPPFDADLELLFEVLRDDEPFDALLEVDLLPPADLPADFFVAAFLVAFAMSLMGFSEG